jgi:hypothetical protein
LSRRRDRRIDIVGLDQPDAGCIAYAAQDRCVQAGGQYLVKRAASFASLDARPLSLIVRMFGLSVGMIRTVRFLFRV